MSDSSGHIEMAPPGEPGAIPRDVPRGLEVLIKKAAVDPAFKDILFEKRAGAAEAIGLELTPAEEALLAAVPLAQLEGIIAHTRISPKLKPVFLGYAAGAMLAALGPGALDYGLDRYNIDREPNRMKELSRTLKAYPVHYEGSPQPIRGLRDVVSAFTKDNRPPGKDVDSIVFRHFFSTGITAVIEKPRDSYNYCPYVKVDTGVWLLTNTFPTSIKGSAAGHRDRSLNTIGSVFRKHLIGVNKVYRSARAKNPSLAGGEVVVEITILADGTVGDAHVVSDTLGDEVFLRSLLARIRNWHFPRIEEGDVTVIYPFVFLPAQDESEK